MDQNCAKEKKRMEVTTLLCCVGGWVDVAGLTRRFPAVLQSDGGSTSNICLLLEPQLHDSVQICEEKVSCCARSSTLAQLGKVLQFAGEKTSVTKGESRLKPRGDAAPAAIARHSCKQETPNRAAAGLKSVTLKAHSLFFCHTKRQREV